MCGDMPTPEEFIGRLEEPRRAEVQRLHELIRERAPGLAASASERMIGYGPYHYRYASGREGDSHLIGLASNKSGISVYVQSVTEDGYLAEQRRDRLGKASVGKACVRFKRTSDIDLEALGELIAEAVRVGPPGEPA
jgi:hypothetical protein